MINFMRKSTEAEATVAALRQRIAVLEEAYSAERNRVTELEYQTKARKATPHEQLISELLDSRIPKTEREHAAAREIETLRLAVDREWVGLTVEEISEAYGSVNGKEWCLGGVNNAEVFYDAIEAKLKEKNT